MNRDDRYQLPKYLIRRKVLKLFGQAFHIYDQNGNVVLYSRLKAFKLREDIRLYSDENMTTELLTIKARQILDFGATYDIIDVPTQAKVGALRRKALKSFIRDEWLILNNADQEIGRVFEDNLALALFRRFILRIAHGDRFSSRRAGIAGSAAWDRGGDFVVGYRWTATIDLDAMKLLCHLGRARLQMSIQSKPNDSSV